MPYWGTRAQEVDLGRFGSFTIVALLLAVPATAFAEGSDSDATTTIGLGGRTGMTGFMDMIDARNAGLLSIRSGTRYDLFVRDRNFDNGDINVNKTEERHSWVTYVGASLFGFVDVSASIPYTRLDDENNLKGLEDPTRTESEDGWGSVDLAAKITLTIGPFVVGPYVHGTLPSGEPEVRDLATLYYGSSVTFTLLNEYVGLHLNLAGVQIEKGTTAVNYRLGVSFVPWAGDTVTARIFAYTEGLEYEGSADSDIDAEFGLQLLLYDYITIELGFTIRLVDGGHVNTDLDRELRDLQTGQGIIDKAFEDDGTWGLILGIGTVF